MTRDDDFIGQLEGYLDEYEGMTPLPPAVRDAIRAELPNTRQIGPIAGLMRDLDMTMKISAPVRYGLVAAVAIAAVVLGAALLGRGPNVGGEPEATASPPTASPVAVPLGDLAAGTTYFWDDPCCVGAGRISFTMPATGWFTFDPIFLGKGTRNPDHFDLYISPHLVGNLYTGGCHWLGTALDPPVGPTVDDLATALNAQAGPGASPPIAVTVGGHPGKKVELSIPENLDVTTCDSDGDFPIFGRWYTDSTFGAAPWTYGNGQHNTVYIIDVDSTRQVIDTMYLPGTSTADRAALDQIVASIRFEPRPASPSPSP